MKKILLICGAGVITSTIVADRLAKYLDRNGYGGRYRIDQGRIDELDDISMNYDVCVSTVRVSQSQCVCPLVDGETLLINGNHDKVISQIVKYL